MRRIGRREERYEAKAAGTKERPHDWYDRVFLIVTAKEREYRRTHGGRRMGAISWNALWERVRDELYVAAWACERQRAFAVKMAYA